MSRRLIIIIGMLLFLVGVTCDKGGDGEPEVEQIGGTAPNVFLIVLDAAAAPYFGCYGDVHGTSPNIDRLAAESVLFENASSQTATTITSTASLLTGVRATTHLMTDTTTLPEALPTLAERLSQRGMKTYGFIGNPFAGAPETGLGRGYDTCVRVYDLASLKGNRRVEKSSRFRVTRPEDINEQVFEALTSFEKNGVFSYIHYLQPHKPYDPPKEVLRAFPGVGTLSWDDLHDAWNLAHKRHSAERWTIRQIEARYRANIRFVDAGVGRLIGRLKKDGLYDESLIILMSDHGDAFFKHKRFGHNVHLYDDMVRIPLMIKFPKSDKVSPRRIANLVETIDIPPTIFDYLGLDRPALFEGDSLWPLILGETRRLNREEVVTCTIQRNRHAIRFRDYKYIYNKPGPTEELYFLPDDPDEQHNLIVRERKRADTLREMLDTIVDVNSGKTLASSNRLRSNDEMDSLLKGLGYTDSDAISDQDERPTTQSAESATQPATPTADRQGGIDD
ncbi:MAG: sulfatase [Phycisphaerae bacterium]